MDAFIALTERWLETNALDALTRAFHGEPLGVADSVLSKHVRVLHEAGYVDVHKSACGSRVRTSLSLTSAGRAAYGGHVAALRAIARRGLDTGPAPPGPRVLRVLVADPASAGRRPGR